jgi:hypothetical protein
LRALDERRLGWSWAAWWTISGVFVAAGFYGYFTGRFIFIAVALIVLLAVVLRQAPWKEAVLGLAVAGVVSGALFAPMARKIVNEWDFFNQRTNDVSIFKTEEPYEGDLDEWVILRKNVVRNYEGFILQDGSETQRGLWTRYNPVDRAPLDRVAAPLFWAGLIVGLWRWRQSYAWYTFFAPLFIAEVFSTGTPDLARGVLIAPFYFLFIGLAFDEAIRRARDARWRYAIASGIAVLAMVIGVKNVYDYFDWQTDAATQDARLPGVAGCEFDLWRGLAERSAANGTRVDDVEFTSQRRELSCSSITRRAIGPAEEPADVEGGDADNQRQRDLDALADALQTYHASHGAYPEAPNLQSFCRFPDLDAGCAVEEVLDPLPRDPLPDGDYLYLSDGQSFLLFAVLEGPAPASECPEPLPETLVQRPNVYCVRGEPPG